MGKRIIQQRRGRGTFRYKSPSHRFKARTTYRKYDTIEKTGVIFGKIIDIIDCPGHSSPLIKIVYENGEKVYLPAPQGVRVNDIVASGVIASVQVGNVLPLKNIPDGTNVFCIESLPGSGPTFIRSSGTFAKILSKLKNKVIVQLPSKKIKEFNPFCRATIGILAAGARTEKPFVKAGKKYFAMKARGRLYPITSGVSMNATDHPFGSGRGSHVGKPITAPRFAPAGRNVGLIRARRTGRRR